MNTSVKTSLRNVLLGGVSAVAVGVFAAPAFAQSDQTAQSNKTQSSPPVETVVVSGIRGSLENAAIIKRNADTFVDAITASDVSALPDVSVSEALGRIPGVTVTRYQYGGASPDFPSAEGSGNLVRGLAFVRSEFNGRDEFSANGGRALDWSSIPPELVGGVDVYKNSSAELIEGGIAGTINLRTLEPFDRQGFFAALSGDATYADLRSTWSPSYSGIISDRWETGVGEFGLMASYSFSNLKSAINDWQQGAPIPRMNVTAPETAGSAKFAGVSPSNIVGIIPVFQLRHPEITRSRASYYVAAQWQNENSIATFNYIRVWNHTDTVEHTIEHLPDINDGVATTVSNMTLTPFNASVALCNAGDGPSTTPPYDCNTMIPVGGGLMTSGLISSEADSWFGPDGYNVHTLSRGVVDTSLTEDYSLNFKSHIADHWHVNLDAQYTSASASNVELWGVLETHLNVFEKTGLDHPAVQFYEPANNAIKSNYLYAGETSGNVTSTADPNGYNWLATQDQEHQGTGDEYATRADVAYDFDDSDWFKDVKFGARYSSRSQTNDINQANWSGVSPAWAGHGESIVGQIAGPSVYQLDNYKNFYRGGVVKGSNTSFVYVNSNLLLNYNAFTNLFKTAPYLQGSLWQPRTTLYGPNDISAITERTMDLYTQLDFEHDFSNGMSIDGNIGVRYAKTDLSSTGQIAYHPFNAKPACTPSAITTVYACSHNSPQDFLPETAAYVSQSATAQDIKNGDSHWLPSFNLKWNLNDEMLFRFAASDGLTRPNVQDERAGQVYAANTTLVPWPTGHMPGINDGVQNITLSSIGVTGGNPDLKPMTARSYDISYEWYFHGGYTSIGGFYKSLHNLIYYGTQTIGSKTLDGATVPIVYSGQVNANAAKVKGFEAEYQQFYDFLPGILSHLGTQANFTFIDAALSEPPTGCTTPGGGPCRFGLKDLYGQSKYIMNLIGIYQDETWEVRVAYDWRSKYLVSYSDYMTGNPIFNSPAGFLDGSIKYNINDNLQLRASFENILDTKNKAMMLINANNQYLNRYSVINDRRAIFGLRYQW